MILVIDTSSTLIARVAVVDPVTKQGRAEMFTTNRDNRVVIRRLRQIAQQNQLTAVAVVTGPGSFTGLRVGVSYGLGLAMGLRIPIIPLPTLDLYAARSDEPATAVVEAGRGRVYYQLPGGKPVLGDPADVPATHPLVGNVAPLTESALTASGHRFVPNDHSAFSKAVMKMLETAREVAYGSLKIEYMQSLSAGQ